MAAPAKRLEPADNALLVRVERRDERGRDRHDDNRQYHDAEGERHPVITQPVEHRLPIAAHPNRGRAVDLGIRRDRAPGHHRSLVHARRILGSSAACNRSTTRLVATKISESARIVPCSTGMSRLMIALNSRKPLPGQVNTVSTRMEPPIR